MYKAFPEGPGRNLFRWKGADREIIKTQTIRLTRETYHCLNIVYTFNRAQHNNRDPKRFSGLIKTRTFPCQKGVQNRTLTLNPQTFTKDSAILLQTPLVSCWHQRGAFGNPLSGRDIHPAHLGTSCHKLSMWGC